MYLKKENLIKDISKIFRRYGTKHIYVEFALEMDVFLLVFLNGVLSFEVISEHSESRIITGKIYKRFAKQYFIDFIKMGEMSDSKTGYFYIIK